MKLHIGCKGEKIDGFKRLDIVQHGDVDFVRNANDLSCFEDGSIDEIYASHILEHFYKPDVPKVLSEWHRVLKQNGFLWISVPDFDAIVNMYLSSGRRLDTWTTHLINGDQLEPYSFHYNVFTYQTLSGLLSQAGFSRMDRVRDLEYNVRDASKITDSRFGQPISINIKAVK